MQVNISYTYEGPYGDVELKIEADIRPGRAAPPCSNHDSPAFSDSGDPPEINSLECFRVTDDGTEDFDYDTLSSEVRDKIEDKLFDSLADRYPYADDDRAFDAAREDGRI